MKKIILTILVLSLSLSLFASAVDRFAEFREFVKEGNLEEAISTYDLFLAEKGNEIRDLRRSAEWAWETRNIARANSLWQDFRALRVIRMDANDTEALLSLIDEKGSEADAIWLKGVSHDYKPGIFLISNEVGVGYNINFSSFIGGQPGQTVVLPSQANFRVSSSQIGILKEWVDENGNTYLPGEEIEIPINNLNLTAVWTPGVIFTDFFSGVRETYTDISEGESVNIPALPSPGDGYIFSGWADKTSGILLSPDSTEWVVEGAGGIFDALWKYVEIPSREITIQSGRRYNFDLRIENLGTDTIRNATVTLIDESGTLTFSPPIKVGKINAARVWDARLSIVARQAGTYPVTAVITDRDGNSWTGTITVNVN